MIMLMSVLLEAWGQVYVWILLMLRPQPSCVTAPSYANAAPHMLWAASISCCPLPPFCLYPIAPPLSSLIKHVSSIPGFSLAVPSSPIHFLGGRPTLSSRVLPVLGLLHHVVPAQLPLPLQPCWTWTVLSPSLLYFPPHMISLWVHWSAPSLLWLSP